MVERTEMVVGAGVVAFTHQNMPRYPGLMNLIPTDWRQEELRGNERWRQGLLTARAYWFERRYFQQLCRHGN